MPKISSFQEVSGEDLLERAEFDVLLGCITHESRCLNVFSKVQKKKCRRVFLDSLSDAAVAKRCRTIVGRTATLLPCGEKLTDIELALSKEIANTSEEHLGPLTILLDISSMPRPYMAAVVSALNRLAEAKPYRVILIYSLAKYTPPPSSISPNITVNSVHPQFSGWTSMPGKPIAAIVGLGYERNKAIGAVEYLQTSDWWLFLPNSAEPKFRAQVNKMNKSLCDSTDSRRRLEYDVHSPIKTYAVLEALVSNAKKTFKPVLLPFGPRIFFFLSLLVSLTHPEASVWYVSGEADDPKTDRSASSHLIGLDFELRPTRA
jgi:hypothetical protein